MIYYKPKFIINSVENIDMSLHDNTILIDILSNFDYYDDKKYIIENLSLCKRLYLNSFVYFRLKKLTSEWNETAELVNQNSMFLNDKQTKKELSKFLMDGIVSKVDNVKLSLEKKNILLHKKDGSIKTNSIFYALNSYDNILFKLINQYPKKIEVENYKEFDVHFIQNLYDLFGNRVELID